VVDDHHERGLGCRIVQALLGSPPVATSEAGVAEQHQQSGIYKRLGFSGKHGQRVLVSYRKANKETSG
jgi:hypothetical protein